MTDGYRYVCVYECVSASAMALCVQVDWTDGSTSSSQVAEQLASAPSSRVGCGEVVSEVR